jgi:hypothetical protein
MLEMIKAIMKISNDHELADLICVMTMSAQLLILKITPHR